MREAKNDTDAQLSDLEDEGSPFAPAFLAFYKERTGRDYYDAGQPKKIARRILKRGEIADEVEFRLHSGIRGNVEQTLFNDEEIDRVNDMLIRFEGSVGKA